MSGSRVEIVVTLFDILTVIALVPGQAKEALFKDRVVCIPQSE
jgi:hypothetical protein